MYVSVSLFKANELIFSSVFHVLLRETKVHMNCANRKMQKGRSKPIFLFSFCISEVSTDLVTANFSPKMSVAFKERTSFMK